MTPPLRALLLCALCLTLTTALGCDDEQAAAPTCPQDCAASAQVCDPQALVCVACLFSSDCADGEACVNKACVPAAPSCVHDQHCAANAPNRFCASTGRCEWSCLDDTHCTEPPNTRCDPESHACISTSTSSGADADATSDADDADDTGATTDDTNTTTNADATEDTTTEDTTTDDAN